MRSEIRIRPATLADAEQLAPIMRAEDAAECAALGRTPLEALRTSLEASERAWALELGGELAGLFGVESALRPTLLSAPLAAVAWLLTGCAVVRYPKAFAIASRGVLRALLVEHQALANFIDARYLAALRWARWLGAEVRPAVPLGLAGELFHPVIFRRQPWAQPPFP